MDLSQKSPLFLQGGHEMGRRIREFDWASHPLGPTDLWPPALRMALSLCLNSSFPTAIYWGPDLHLLYNDSWSAIPAERHPWALGRPAREVWSDIWSVVGPQLAQVMATGEGIARFEQMLPMERDGVPRETWWNYSFTALRNTDNTIGGVFNQGNEITDLVLARRQRQAELARLQGWFRQAPTPIALLRGPEHVFEIANDAYLAMVGGRDLLGKPVKDALPEAEEQGFVALLDDVLRTGRPYIANSSSIQLQRAPGQSREERVLDFIYQPVVNAEGHVDGVFVLATDVTDRARAETALRLSNWQLAEERARLATTVEAEQRAQAALRRFNETLEANVNLRTAQLERTVAKQVEVADRLRATFETSLIYQGFLDTQGTLLDANTTSLQAIRSNLDDVVGRPFWEAPWFTATPGLPEFTRDAVAKALAGKPVRTQLEVNLPVGTRRLDFCLRPALNGKGEVIGAVSEALDITER